MQQQNELAACRLPHTSGTMLGIDIGSTTVKILLFEAGECVFSCYERHFSRVREKTMELITSIAEKLAGKTFSLAIAGSAGYGMARAANLPFVQEVFATNLTVEAFAPDTDVVIELGGEDAKIIFFGDTIEERMNGSCAGGTGAFIDQMATLLDVSGEELDRMSLASERIYPIASRCGVFAKTDIQPLINQGARREDIAASIYQAVVNQTIAGLAQGYDIAGNVMFLGGPLYYCKGLQKRFVETLRLSPEAARFPAWGRYAVAIGAALQGARERARFTFEALNEALASAVGGGEQMTILAPLFATQADYTAFTERHAKALVETLPITAYRGRAYLGIDCGSTTTKLVLIGEDAQLLYTYYSSNRGNPVDVVLAQLLEIYRLCGDRITIAGSAATGYGEELMQHAFHVDWGLVETMAHFRAAHHFNPHVDFILDIGGQDIKCFRVRNGVIDSILLNEACSSGCGSFLETFAKGLGYEVEEFAKVGLFAKAPVDLGSRCTVFMNSSVKQAQKDGASVADISAGLSVSVVKNAIYKVIRATSAESLGKEIVVQGGTFLNNAVLRAFEQELGRDVIRPNIAGLMGAYGAALHAKDHATRPSTLLTAEELSAFTHTAKSVLCNGCTNHCRLTVNTFADGARFISGNQCEKGLGLKTEAEAVPNLFVFKRERLEALMQDGASAPATRGTIGLPLALGMFELAPLWHGIFTSLGFRVKFSGFATRALYAQGQHTIPSDTACYPAKIMHGHIEKLLADGVDAIFYPSLSYNLGEKDTKNCYNCPVVAYYAELLHGNVSALQNTKFLYPYLNINSQRQLAKELYACLNAAFPGMALSEVRDAVRRGFSALTAAQSARERAGAAALEWARAHNKPVMILAGRPYHIDPEICHSIDKLATSIGFVVVSEDSVCNMGTVPGVRVLNQWTYHARLYRAAAFAAEHRDVQLVQLVSFGCGLDAITTDEVREILERAGKLYTQIKMDEITNQGAVKIRLRSLLGALTERGLA